MLKKYLPFKLALPLFFVLYAAGPIWAEESAEVVGRTIAIVNNEPIFFEELNKEAEPFIERQKKLAPKEENTPDKLLDIKREILDKMVEEKLLLQEAKNKNLRVTKAEIEKGVAQFKEPFSVDEQGKPRTAIDTEKKFQEQLTQEGMTQTQFNERVKEQIMKVKLIEQDVKSKVEMPAESDVKAFYNKIKQTLDGKTVAAKDSNEQAEIEQVAKFLGRLIGEQIRIRHILARATKAEGAAARETAKTKIKDVQDKLTKGEDFTFLAKKFSEDPISKDRGGDLGFLAKGDLGLPEIDETVFKLNEGQISGIIETDIGFHIVKLIEKRAPHPLDYDEVKEDLKNFIVQKSFTANLEKYLKNLRAKASIKINPIN